MMRVLGIRTSPAEIRYALLDWDGSAATLVNATLENKLVFPATAITDAQKLAWFDQELDRILRGQPRIELIGLKVNDYQLNGKDTKASRESAYYDAAVLIAAGRHGVPITTFLYRQMGTKRLEVKVFAETHVGSTEKYWNEQMAAAVAAAYAVTQA